MTARRPTRTAQVLRERLKELTCLYRVAQICRQGDRPLPELLRAIAATISSAWQHPERTWAELAFDGCTYRSAEACPEGAAQTAPLIVQGRRRGAIRMVCPAARRRRTASPFLREEQDLLDELARQVALTIEAREVREAHETLQQQLHHADRLATLGKLAAGVAHELNEPLGAILGFAQLLRKTARLPDRAARDLRKIEMAALQARDIIRGLLTFARPSRPRREPVSIPALIADGLVRWALPCEDGAVTVERRLAPGLPCVAGDAAQLRQVLANLVRNAIQAMPDGGVLRLVARPERDGVALTVADTGQGIAAEDLPRVFDPFFTTKDVDQGVGLGLSVVHGIVRAHGGTIAVESTVGQGTRVRLWLPAARPATGPERPP